jgi:hypothetical protein
MIFIQGLSPLNDMRMANVSGVSMRQASLRAPKGRCRFATTRRNDIAPPRFGGRCYRECLFWGSPLRVLFRAFLAFSGGWALALRAPSSLEIISLDGAQFSFF